MLYSDTVSIDSAYLEITGKTYFEGLNSIEINRQRLIKEEEEYQETIPTNTKLWIEKGHKILAEEYWNKWDECVPIRLADLYHGMELEACLSIVERLNGGCLLGEAKSAIDNQGHSGMSYGLVKSMVVCFCKRGQEFAEYIVYKADFIKEEWRMQK